MLTESELDRLIEPIVARQQSINRAILEVIAARLRDIGTLLPSDLTTIQQLYRNGEDIRKIIKLLSRMSGMQARSIKDLLEQVAQDAYMDSKVFYDFQKVPFIPFKKNKALQAIIQSIAQETAKTCINLSNSQACGFLIEDKVNPGILKYADIRTTYQNSVDTAVQAVQSGVVDYNSAMRKTLQTLVNSGLRRLAWKSGYTQRLDTALRRNILDGIRAINQGVQDEVGRQFGADGVELSAHANSAPDHEPVQGRQFTKVEFDKLQHQQAFQDVNGKTYQPIARPIGVWNCRHIAFNIVIGSAVPAYTEEQLKEMAKRNAKGYTDSSGRHYTLYQCTQIQRSMELKIRVARDGKATAETAGDQQLAAQYEAKIATEMKKYGQFCRNCGLRARYDKTK